MTSREVLDVLNFINKTNKTFESSLQKIYTCLPSAVYSDDEKVFIRMGKDRLKRCADRFQTMRERIERYINTRLVLDAGLLRVISMTSELNTEVYECSICLSVISKVDQTWSCSSCYHVLHLTCVREHVLHQIRTQDANAPLGAWNCPICRHEKCVDEGYQCVYTCFCGAVKNPQPNAFTAHGCGRRCRRTPHCKMECHPAACPITQ